MATTLKVHAIFEKHGNWYIGYIPEVPGVNAQEHTLKAARESLLIALHELAEIDPKAVLGVNRRIEELELTLDGNAP
jgi:predicted RNase H-like HicB family nuclease